MSLRSGQRVPAAGGALPVMPPIVYGLILVVSTAPRYLTCDDLKANIIDTLLYNPSKGLYNIYKTTSSTS